MIWRLAGLALVVAALGGIYYMSHMSFGPQGPMGPLPVLVAPLEATSYRPSLTFTGRLSSVSEAQVRPALGGVVTKIHYTEGQQVAAGAPLFTLDLRSYNPQARQAAAQLTQARAAYARGVELRAQDAISQADLESRRAALLAAQAGSSEAGVDGTSAVVKAPIAGRVGRNEVTLGAVVDGVNQGGGTLLTTIQQQDPVYVDFEMNEQTYLELVGHGADGQAAGGSLKGVPVAVGLAASGTDFPLEATLTGIDNRLGGETGSLRLRATMANPGGMLLSGLFARVKVDLPQQAQGLVVNDAAIGTDQNLRFVHKIGADEKPVRVVVNVGTLVNGLRVISAVSPSTLVAGDRVVINGLLRLALGIPVVPMPADMRTLQPLNPPPGAPAQGKPAAAPSATEAGTGAAAQ